jgi:hypothetical protein
MDEDGKWLLPRYTLGWQILGWIAEWLTLPDGSPWLATPEQARFILWMYAVDENGEWLYRNIFLQRLKGWGKDPVAATLCIVHLVGPCVFSHWDEDGNPVGKMDDQAYIQIAATSKDQTENTRDLFPSLIPKRTREAFDMDVQREIIYARGGQVKVRAVSANPRSLEGGRVSLLIAGEPHHWTKTNGGVKFYYTSSNNLTKFSGRMLVITNAYEPGEGSVAEIIRTEQEKVWAGLQEPTGWLYDSLEAHPKAPLVKEWAPYIVETIKGDSWWLKTKGIVTAIQDSSIPSSTHRRFWFNQIVATEDALYSPAEWDAILADGCYGTKADLQPGDEIVAGFDGGKTDDATALVAIRIRDKLIVPLFIEQRPDGALGENWQINPEFVDSEVKSMFAVYKVKAFFADVNLWESYIAQWSELYRETLDIKATPKGALHYDMRGNKEEIARCNESLMQHVKDGMIRHNGDKLLRIHVLNGYRAHNGKGITVRKENPESPRKIDGYVAALIAFIALTRLAESGKKAEVVYRRRLMQI